MKNRAILKLKVEKIIYEGKALSRDEGGKMVFLEGLLPGELVLAEQVKVKRDYIIARPMELLEASPARRHPLCPHFSSCGGCLLQFASYEKQLEIKEGFLRESLSHLGGIDASCIMPIVPAPSPFAYRNKMEFTFSRDGEIRIGLHPKGNFYRVTDLNECPISSFPVSDFFPALRDWAKKRELSVWHPKLHQGALRNFLVRKSSTSGEMLLDLISAEELSEGVLRDLEEALPQGNLLFTLNQAWGDTHRVDHQALLRGQPYIFETLAGLKFRISPRSFFQTNTQGALRLYEYVVGLAQEVGARRVLDLYCGTGTIACLLSGKVEEVWGVEKEESAVSDAEDNARQNNLGSVHFLRGEVEEMLSTLNQFDLVVVDPPRNGLHPRVLPTLISSNFPYLIYISCNPVTLARDLKELSGYELVSASPFDLFPQTFHVETVVLMKSEKRRREHAL